MDDAELVRAARNGDIAAFTSIFDRHSARVHDLALAMLRDRAAALAVVEATFLEASLRLLGLEDGRRLPVWLLAVARRNAALRAGPTAGADRQPSLPGDDPERIKLAGLVWEAVADLPLRDRTLIDLDLRQGLDGQDLADALGVTLTQAQDLQARMRDRIEKGLSGYLIAQTAEGRCLELSKVLKGWDGRFTPKHSAHIARHVEGCRVCNQIRFGLPSAFTLYAAALPAPFPAAVRPRVLERLVLPLPPGGPVPVPAPGYEAEGLSYQHPLPAMTPSYEPAPDAVLAADPQYADTGFAGPSGDEHVGGPTGAAPHYPGADPATAPYAPLGYPQPAPSPTEGYPPAAPPYDAPTGYAPADPDPASYALSSAPTGYPPAPADSPWGDGTPDGHAAYGAPEASTPADPGLPSAPEDSTPADPGLPSAPEASTPADPAT
ncbi:MAG: hypothetical protein ABIS47_02670, partial [Acidimicrobiales bacterium]